MKNIEMIGIYKSYNNIEVLRNFQMKLAQGEKTALMGASGIGKTTIARLLLGLEKQDKGTIKGLENIKLACVFQEDRLCPHYSAMQNIVLVAPKASSLRIAGGLKEVGLKEQDFYKPVSQLSGGQQRRVALVRALEAESDFVVLDEAFKGLDTANKQKAYAYTLHKLKGKTMLLVTHDAQEAACLTTAKIVVGKQK